MAVILGQLPLGMECQHAVYQLARRWRFIYGIDCLRNHGNNRQLAYGVSTPVQFIAETDIPFFVLDRLGAQHEMRKIDIPGVGWNIGALRHEAHIAEVAAIGHLPEFLLFDSIQLAGGPLVYQVEQAGKCCAQIDAAAAAVANIEHTLHLGEQLWFVVKIGIFPIERMTFWSLKAAFSGGHALSENQMRNKTETNKTSG